MVSKIITTFLGGAGYLFWDSERVCFAFGDVAPKLQHLFPVMIFAMHKFLSLKITSLQYRLSLLKDSSIYVSVKKGKIQTKWSCVVLSSDPFL